MFIDIAYASEVAKVATDEGVLASLGIHGIQILEQLFNFTLVSVILWFLILKPLTKKMAERQKMIEDSVDNVKKIEVNLGMSEKKYQEKIDQAKVDANKIIEKASMEALAVAEVAKEKTRKEIEQLVEDARKNIKTERNESIVEIKQQVASLVVEAAEKILAGKIDIEKDNKVVEDAIKNLK